MGYAIGYARVGLPMPIALADALVFQCKLTCRCTIGMPYQGMSMVGLG